MRGEDVDGVILGCTEFGLLVNQEDLPIPMFDTAELHAKAAMDFALAPEHGGFRSVRSEPRGFGQDLTEILDVVVLFVGDPSVKLTQFLDQMFGCVLGDGHLTSLHSAKVQRTPRLTRRGLAGKPAVNRALIL